MLNDVPKPAPSALPGISPSGGEIDSRRILRAKSAVSRVVRNTQLERRQLKVRCLGKPVPPANLPTCGGDARQGRGGCRGV